jgi:hypothetical protein
MHMTKLFDPVAHLDKIEQSVGVESFEALVGTRRTLLHEGREDEALFGPYGLWDERRRALRGVISDELREMARTTSTKMTEAAIEDQACADVRYQNALNDAFHGKMRYLEKSALIREIEDRIRNRDILMRMHIAEARVLQE